MLLDPVDQAELLGLVRGHEVVAVQCVQDALHTLARVMGVDLVEAVTQATDLVRADDYVRGGALKWFRKLLYSLTVSLG